MHVIKKQHVFMGVYSITTYLHK